MKIFIIILFTFFTTAVYSQNKLIGVYERKWSAHSTLRLLPDSTFEEKYLSFTCVMYASVFKDSVFKGTWRINKGLLELKFNPTAHDKSWNVSHYFIDTFSQQLIQIENKNASFLNYVKTKEFDNAGNIAWTLNPTDIITSFENIPYDTEKTKKGNNNSSKRAQLTFLLQFWLRDQADYKISDTRDYKFADILYNSPMTLIEQIYFVGQLKYRLANPGDTSIVNQKKAGLTAVLTAYSTELYKNYKNKRIENLVAIEAKGELEEYVRRKLK